MRNEIEIVVITYNAPERLRLVLWGIAKQETDRKFRVRVVNDGGGNEVESVVDSFRRLIPVAYYLLRPRTRRRRLSMARNFGVEKAHANGRVGRVLCLDGDCIPGPNVVEQHVGFGDQPVIACGVRHRIHERVADCLTQSDITSLESSAYSNDDRYRDTPEWRRARLRKVRRMESPGAAFPHLCHGFQASYPVREFRRVGGFCPQLQFRQDQDLAQRLVAAGCTTILLPDSVCYHLDHPMDRTDPDRRKSDALYRSRWGSE